jgi:hypothetical protein
LETISILNKYKKLGGDGMNLKNGFTKAAGLVLLSTGILSNSCYADITEYRANGDKIIAKVSAGVQNRIEVVKSSIVEVIGNTAQYSIIANPNSDYLYLIPRVRPGNNIALSIIHGDSKAIELSLKVESGSGETIIIDDSNSDLKNKDGELNSTKPQDLVKETAEMMRHMVLGKKGKYHVEDINRIITTPKTSDINLNFALKYNFENAGLIGRKVIITNKSSQPLNITPSDFEHLFENVIAISSDGEILGKGARGNIYLISKVSKWNRG